MRTSRRVLILCIILMIYMIISVSSFDRYKRNKASDEVKNKTKPPTLNTDLVPSLEKIIEEIGLSHRLQDLYKMGVVDTRILLRLKKMDFHMMSMEWSEVKQEEINALKQAVEKYVVLATVQEEEIEIRDFSERNRLTFGRLHIPNSVQSFEYLSGSFGSVPPIGLKEIFISEDIKGCTPYTTDLSEKIVVTQRGRCSFLQKALYAKRAGAVVLAIVNDVDKIDNIASGFGVDKNVTEAMVNEVAKLSVISLSSQALLPLQYAISSSLSSSSSPLTAQVIPVKCGISGTCEPVIPEEMVNLEVTSGTLQIIHGTNGHYTSTVDSSLPTFDFLTSTYGGVIPTNIMIQQSSPIDACQPLQLQFESETSLDGEDHLSSPFALFVHRGGCRFEVKAQNAQNAGAKMLIIANMNDEALQRVGAAKEAQGTLGIPSILVTMMAGKHIEERLLSLNSTAGSISVEFTSHNNDMLSKAWIDLAFTSFEDMNGADELLAIDGLIESYMNYHSTDIISWLQRKKMHIQRRENKAVPAA